MPTIPKIKTHTTRIGKKAMMAALIPLGVAMAWKCTSQAGGSAGWLKRKAPLERGK
jgi:hypothetical protein